MSVNFDKLSAAINGAITLIQSQRAEAAALRSENEDLKAHAIAAADSTADQAAADAQADLIAAEVAKVS